MTELCLEQTWITQHGISFDYSVPRFCNREKGHTGDHVYDFDKGMNDEQE